MSIYLAFKNGSIRYDCQPCGRCCRGMGFGVDATQFKESKELVQLAPFMASPDTARPVVDVFTYRDGCRYLDNENLCELHRRDGSQAKPRICRLFPFSRLIELDGLRAIIPDRACPWVAAESPDPLSSHESVYAELREDWLAAAQPMQLTARTRLSVDVRRRSEEAIRDALDSAASVDENLHRMRAAQEEGSGERAHRLDRDVVYDLMRLADAPAALPVSTQRVFTVASPSIRLLLAEDVSWRMLPAALEAFAVWLRTLAEIESRPLRGDDLLGFLEHARPVVVLLVAAARPIPALPAQAPGLPHHIQPIWELLHARAGEPLGEVILRCLAAHPMGAIATLRQLGLALRPYIDWDGELDPSAGAA